MSGKEVAFEGWAPGEQIGDQRRVRLRNFKEIFRRAEAGSFDGPRNVEHGEALGNDYGVEVDVAAGQALLHVDEIGGLLEQIFSGLQRDGGGCSARE